VTPVKRNIQWAAFIMTICLNLEDPVAAKAVL
jgi:hypothetical protein